MTKKQISARMRKKAHCRYGFSFGWAYWHFACRLPEGLKHVLLLQRVEICRKGYGKHRKMPSATFRQ